MTPDLLETAQQPDTYTAPYELSGVVVHLLKGVLYQEGDAPLWNGLVQLQARVRDYVRVLGLELIIDEAEGYAFLRSRPDPEDQAVLRVPRLIARRPLSFRISLLLALLRKKLAEFDATGGDTRLVLSRDEIVDLIRVFLPEGSNETRLVNDVESSISRIVELGFLRRLKSASGVGATADTFEVRRILKAFVDAQWLAEFDSRIDAYRRQLAGTETGNTDD